MRYPVPFVATRASGYFLLLVLLPALMAGCDGGLGPDDPTWPYSLSVTTDVQLPLTTIANGAAGELRIRGPYASPLPHDEGPYILPGLTEGV